MLSAKHPAPVPKPTGYTESAMMIACQGSAIKMDDLNPYKPKNADISHQSGIVIHHIVSAVLLSGFYVLNVKLYLSLRRLDFVLLLQHPFVLSTLSAVGLIYALCPIVIHRLNLRIYLALFAFVLLFATNLLIINAILGNSSEPQLNWYSIVLAVMLGITAWAIISLSAAIHNLKNDTTSANDSPPER
jgi:hypothetical protein